MNLLEEIAHLLRTEPMIRVADGYCVLDEESANKVATSLLPIMEKAVQAGMDAGATFIETHNISYEREAVVLRPRIVQDATSQTYGNAIRALSASELKQEIESARELARTGDYNEHPCEIGYAETIVDLAARIEQLEAALRRQGDNMAFILNHATLTDFWYAKLTRELEMDRAALETKHD